MVVCIIKVIFSIICGTEYFIYSTIVSFGFVQYPWIQSIDSTVAIFEWNVISKVCKAYE